VPHRELPSAVVAHELAQGGHVQQQSGSRRDVEVHPGDRDGPDDVAVRKREHVAFALECEGDELTRARIGGGGGLASWAAVTKEVPAGMRLVDLGASQALVLAVVELLKEGRDLRV